jgi:hypothetical protein
VLAERASLTSLLEEVGDEAIENPARELLGLLDLVIATPGTKTDRSG